jgi:hypothetical protein
VRHAAALVLATSLATPSLAHAQSPSPSVEPSSAPPSVAPLALPREGKGALVFGSIFAFTGLTATSLGAIAFAEGSTGWGFGGVVPGVPVLGVGLGVMALGIHRHRAYQRWLTTTPLRPPRSGQGLLGAGFGVMFTGLGVLAASTIHGLSDIEPPPGSVAGLALGGMAFATGGVLITIGSVRNGRWNAWRRNPIVPTLALAPRGMAFGIAGRF